MLPEIIPVDFLRKECIEEGEPRLLPQKKRLLLLQSIAHDGIIARAFGFIGSLKGLRSRGAHREAYARYREMGPVVLVEILEQGENALWQKCPQFYLAIAKLLKEKVRWSFTRRRQEDLTER
jgi:hypothetical protein